jgi:hypothetical protein
LDPPDVRLPSTPVPDGYLMDKLALKPLQKALKAVLYMLPCLFALESPLLKVDQKKELAKNVPAFELYVGYLLRVLSVALASRTATSPDLSRGEAKLYPWGEGSGWKEKEREMGVISGGESWKGSACESGKRKEAARSENGVEYFRLEARGGVPVVREVGLPIHSLGLPRSIPPRPNPLSQPSPLQHLLPSSFPAAHTSPMNISMPMHHPPIPSVSRVSRGELKRERG